MGNKQQKSRKERRQDKGNQLLQEDSKRKEFDNDWDLDWFNPKGLQVDCIDSMKRNTFTIINGPSGSGKTSVALWYALSELRNRNYQQVIFIKNPTEVGDDKVGFLSGSESDKLMAHMDTTKRIFHSFISKNKLENDILNDKIRLTIPNFLLGATFDNTIVIIDETQTMSKSTVKLLLERCGENSTYIILGDPAQTYSVAKRDDGFSDLIKRCTGDYQGIRIPRYDSFGYIGMTRDDNQRSSGSKLINRIYEEV